MKVYKLVWTFVNTNLLKLSVQSNVSRKKYQVAGSNVVYKLCISHLCLWCSVATKYLCGSDEDVI